MKVILMYDVKHSFSKFNKLCKQYLNWVQNSVFEGEIKSTDLRELSRMLKDMSKDGDSIFIYTINGTYSKDIIGEEKNEIDSFI